MFALLQVFLNEFLVFVLVLTRVSGLVMTAPIFGSRQIPVRIRAFLAVALALIITPVHFNVQVAAPGNLLNFSIMLAREIVLGLALGLAVMILFTGLQLTGQIIGQMSGMSLADVFDPTFQQSVPVFSQLLDTITLSVFVTIGGHRQVMRALLDTFHWRPPGGDDFPPHMVEALTEVTQQSFSVGIRAAAPVIVALLMAVVIMGLISRTLPQLNIIAVGFSVNSVVMMATLALSLGAIAWVIQGEADLVIERMREVLARGP